VKNIARMGEESHVGERQHNVCNRVESVQRGINEDKVPVQAAPTGEKVAFPIESRSSDVISIKEDAMVRVGLFVRLQAKPGKEAEVARFLEGGLAMANQEPPTPIWFAMRLGPATFGIFDAFADDAGRKAHLAGQIAAALMAKAPELLAAAPQIEPVDILAAKI
jgi:quinol monooxygenase YgiN